MAPVARQVHQVVEQIRARRGQAEGYERQACLQQESRFVEPMSGRKGQENQDVLEPVVRAQRREVDERVRRRRRERSLDLGPSRVHGEPRFGAQRDRFARRPPDRVVGAAAADVVEAPRTELGD
jgi:hypothetical protein